MPEALTREFRRLLAEGGDTAKEALVGFWVAADMYRAGIIDSYPDDSWQDEGSEARGEERWNALLRYTGLPARTPGRDVVAAFWRRFSPVRELPYEVIPEAIQRRQEALRFVGV